MKTSNIATILNSIIISFFLTIPVHSQTYIEINVKDTMHFSYHLQQINNTTVITLSSPKKTEICEVDTNYYCLNWQYNNDDKKLSFTATRRSDSIYISGINDNKKFHYSISVGNVPWLQFWEYGISLMIQKQNTILNFFSIDPNKPKKAALFITNKEEKEIIDINSSKELAQRVSVTIKDLPAMIFKAKLWFRIDDNVFLKSQMPQGPFVPITTIELER